MTTLTPGLARSAKEAIEAGLDGGTAISRTLVAKSTGVPPTSFASASLAMFFVSAEAKTSAGAPWVIWVTRSEDPAKLRVTLVPGCLASKSVASSVNVDFSEAAANTVIEPDRPVDALAPEALGDGLPVVAGEQPASPAAKAPATKTAAMFLRRFLIRCSFPAGFR